MTEHKHTFDWVNGLVVCTGCHDYDCGYVQHLTPTEYDDNIDAQYKVYKTWKYLNRQSCDDVSKLQADEEAKNILDTAQRKLAREIELDQLSGWYYSKGCK